MKKLQLPLSLMDIRGLSVGEQVRIRGTLFTAREEAQKYLFDGGTVPFDPHGSILYICGPIGKKRGKKWTVTAAGPEAAILQESYLGEILSRFGFRGVIGRGTLGPKTLSACRRFGACYFQSIGGAALALAQKIQSVREVHLRNQLNGPDAIWELEVEDFPAVVTVDSQGRNLQDLVRDVSSRRFMTMHD